MQDLRLVGVHDDGEHLLLGGTGGEIFRLRIDEALRVASARTSVRPARSAAADSESRSGAPTERMSPRDIQSRIREGATAEEVAEFSGLPLSHVQRYEGPVLAEREHIVSQARKVEVASPTPAHDGYRSAFGDNPATLGEMVAHRLAAHGVRATSVEWDSWRRPDGNWTVVANFVTNPAHPAGIGEEPPAQWIYHPTRKTVQNANRWAQQLSELEPLDGPLPLRRLSAVSDRPFDFESDAGADSAKASVPGGASSHQASVPESGEASETAPEKPEEPKNESDNLLDMLRSRRGQRLGLDEERDDALAVLLTNGVPAAHPRDGDDPEAVPESVPGTPKFPILALAPRASENDEDLAIHLHDGVSTQTREITVTAAPRRRADSSTGSPANLPQPADGGRRAAQKQDSDISEIATTDGQDSQEQPERKYLRQKRSSVPSWDEIVFGTKSD